MRILCFLLFSATLFLSNQALSQTSESLLGTWQVYRTEIDQTDSVRLVYNMLALILFKDATYYFGKDNTYEVHIADLAEDGKWVFNKESGKITFTSRAGTVAKGGIATDIEVKSIRNDFLFLKKDDLLLSLKKVE